MDSIFGCRNTSFLSNDSTRYISNDKEKEVKTTKRKKNSTVKFLVDDMNSINQIAERKFELERDRMDKEYKLQSERSCLCVKGAEFKGVGSIGFGARGFVLKLIFGLKMKSIIILPLVIILASSDPNLANKGSLDSSRQDELNGVSYSRFYEIQSFEKFSANVQVKKSLKSVPIKRKQNAQSSSSKKRSKKAIVINSYTEDHDDNDDKIDKENKSFSKLNELEYQERVLALKERKIALREREADIRIME
ncbi:hypothetical protein RhiirB3_474349 [Rhizophagus irregularis]|nr:hypothetical protein RhiirB3_474349 [Rhizophagus irregularis]